MSNNFRNFRDGVNIGVLASSPSSPVNGDMYYDSGLNTARVYTNGSWVNIQTTTGLTTPTTGSTYGNTTAPSITGINNTAIGVNAGDSVTTGTSNTMIGYNAGTAIADGIQNTIIGGSSGTNITSGGDNTVVGRNAGGGISTADSNTIIGAGAGVTAMGQRNVAVGAGAGVSSAVAAAIALGYNAVATANNQFMAGSSLAPITDFCIGAGETASSITTTIRTSDAPSGTDVSASSNVIRIAGARGRGTGIGGDIVFLTAPASTTGSSLNSLVEAVRIPYLGGLRVGTATSIGTGDYVAVDFTTPDLVTQAVGLRFRTLRSGNSAVTGQTYGVFNQVNRTITTSQTDTSVVAGYRTQNIFNVPSGQTLSNNSTTGYIGFQVSAPTISGGGAISIDNYAGFVVDANSISTGASKVGIQVGAQSGATRNMGFLYGGTLAGTWGLAINTTDSNYMGGSLKIGGITSTAVYTNEALTVRLLDPSNNTSASSTIELRQTSNSAITGTNVQHGIFARWVRTNTSSVTDTNNQSGAIRAGISFNTSTSQTYTNTGSSGVSSLFIMTPAQVGAGTLAITSYAGIDIEASSIATGTNKYGIRIADQSGSTNNWAIRTGLGKVEFGDNLTNAYTALAGDSGSSIQAQNSTLTNAQNSAFTNTVAGIQSVVNRNITSSQTDTGRLVGVSAFMQFNVASAQTLTNTNTVGVASVNIPAPTNAGAGALAFTHYAGLNVEASSLNTGTNKYGIRIGNQSGATNNFAIQTGTGLVSFGEHVEVSGRAAIGGTQSTNIGLRVVNTALNTVNQYGIYASPIGTSAATTTIHGIFAQAQTAAASFTVNTLYHIRASNAVIGSGSTVTTQYGVYVDSLSGAGTNVAIKTNNGIVDIGDDLKLTVVGKGLYVKEGSNATMGTATLTAGSVTVNTTKVTANSRIQLTSQSDGGTPGFLRVSARSAGTSFTITSSNGADTSTVAWIIVEPS